jgi:hypothetical protein
MVIMSIYHHVMLLIERKNISRSGTLVEVDGYNMNIYVEGVDKEQGIPIIVMLSGSGVEAPLYDYKELYSKFTDKYRVAVVEKFGYGYSDISGIERDVVTMVKEDREALKKAGENGPYVLMPHSMSALEAIYWAVKYPEEVYAIIGLDMAVPDCYDENDNNMLKITFMKTMTFMGIHRIPAFYHIKKDGFSKKEIEQLRYLTYRNSLNDDVYKECKTVYDNAKTVKVIGIPDIPILMFTTNLGRSCGWESWVEPQDNFAIQSDKCIQIKLECGHYLHYYESEFISEKIKKFMKEYGW